MRSLRIALFALTAGALASFLRARGGPALADLPLPSPTGAALHRSGALAIVAAAVLLRRSRLFDHDVPPGRMLAFALAGFVGHGLLVPRLFVTSSPLDRAVLAVAALVALLSIASRGAREGSEAPAPPPAERVALALAAAAAATALELLVRRLRLVGAARADDDTVFAAVLLASALLGSVLLGAPLAARFRPPNVLATSLATVPLACLLGLHSVAGLAEAAGLRAALAVPTRVGLPAIAADGLGTLAWSALLGARTLLLPGFAVGVAFAAARGRARLASLLVGAALAPPIALLLVGDGEPTTLGELERAAPAATLVSICALAATVAGVRGRRSLPLLAAVALATLLTPRRAALPLSPWWRAPVEPLLVVDSAAGLATVEPHTDGALVATLDRRRLTPTVAEEPADAQRIAFALALAGGSRVLLVGQLTPARAHALRMNGCERVDRTAPWPHAAAMERALFADHDAPDGAHLTSDEADQLVFEGAYDLVLVPPVAGPALPSLSAELVDWVPADAPAPPTSLPGGTLAITWLPAAADTTALPAGATVVPAGPTLTAIGVGLASGVSSKPWVVGGARDQPPFWRLADQATGPPPALGLLRPWATRLDPRRAAVWRRLAGAPTDERWRTAAGALAAHFDAQEASSPWHTRHSATEVDDAAIAALAASARGAAPDPALRSLVEDAALLLVAKREPDLLTEHFVPLADEHAPWPELDRALAHAWRELLAPERAEAALARASDARPHDIALLITLADVREELGDTAGARVALRRALTLQPGREDLEERLAELPE